MPSSPPMHLIQAPDSQDLPIPSLAQVAWPKSEPGEGYDGYHNHRSDHDQNNPDSTIDDHIPDLTIDQHDEPDLLKLVNQDGGLKPLVLANYLVITPHQHA